MAREDIFTGLCEVIGMVKPKMDISKISESSDLVSELGLDSLTMLLLSLAIEKKFGIEFDTREHFQTVADVLDYISRKAE